MITLKSDSRQWIIWLVLALLVAILMKLWLISSGIVPFNSDEAVVALMGRHILQGERPIFFYGQAYMGSLDAFLVAIGFWLFGQEVWVIRLVQGLLYVGVLITTALLGKAIFDSWRVSVVSIWLLAIPTVNVSLYTTASLGGYVEAMLLGNLILLSGLRIAKNLDSNEKINIAQWILLGFLIGIGLWGFGITLIYSLPVIAYLVWKLVKNMELVYMQKSYVLGISGFVVLGFLLGSSPWWFYAVGNGVIQQLIELSGSAIAGVEGLTWFNQVGQHLINFGLFGITVIFGMRPPWEIRWLGVPLLPLVLMFWTGGIYYFFRYVLVNNHNRTKLGLLAAVVCTLVLGFLLTPFGADPSGRYFVPLAIPLALIGGYFILFLSEKIGFWAWVLLFVLIVFNLWGTVQSAIRYPPGLTTQFYAPTQIDHRYDSELVKFLKEKGETRGYTNYWTAYPLAFLSEEDIIYTPRLPYHTDLRYTQRDDRIDRYGEIVTRSKRLAYITSNNPMLDDYLREQFSEYGVSWDEAQIGDYQIFFGISKVIHPHEIGLGVSVP